MSNFRTHGYIFYYTISVLISHVTTIITCAFPRLSDTAESIFCTIQSYFGISCRLLSFHYFQICVSNAISGIRSESINLEPQYWSTAGIRTSVLKTTFKVSVEFMPQFCFLYTENKASKTIPNQPPDPFLTT